MTGTRMDRRGFLQLSCAASASALTCHHLTGTGSERPNIIIIVAADLG